LGFKNSVSPEFRTPEIAITNSTVIVTQFVTAGRSAFHVRFLNSGATYKST